MLLGAKGELLEYCVTYARILLVALPYLCGILPVYGICHLRLRLLYRIKDGVTSAIISFLRTLVFQIGAVLLLPMMFDIDGIWYSIIVAEFLEKKK